MSTEAGGNGGLYLTSEYYTRAHKKLDKELVKDPEGVEMAKRIVDEVHRQAAENLKLWESSNHPGTSEVVSKISVLEIVRRLGKPELAREIPADSEEIQKKVWGMSSSTPEAGTDGGTHTAFDMTVDLAFRYLPEVISSLKRGEVKDVEIILMGSPLAVGGKVGESFVAEAESTDFFTAQAKLHAEMLEQSCQDPKVKRLILGGHSFGGLAALKIAGELSNIKEKTTVLADSPAPIREGSPAKAIGALVGVIADALPRVMLEDRYLDMQAKKTIQTDYRLQLRRNKIDFEEDTNQQELKAKARNVLKRDMVQGPSSPYPEGVKVYVRQGMFDLVTFTFDRFVKLAKYRFGAGRDTIGPITGDHENVGVWPLKEGHGIDRISKKNVQRWIRAAKDLSLQ